MLFRTLKRMIERGNLDGLEEKIDVFYAADKLNDDEYKTLSGLLEEKKKEEADGNH